jgi:ABC-type sugar transport system ATPase subunit
MLPPLLAAAGLSKRFGAVAALTDVAIDIAAGEVRAVCGENGAGKSTLVKLLTGVHRPDAGTIAIDGRACTIASPRAAQALGIALVAQELSLCPDLSVADNIWLGSAEVPLFHRRAALARRARAALDRLGAGHIGLDVPVGRLAMGERQLVEIARMLTRDARLLILDEPTATLTDAEIERIFAALEAIRAEGRAILYITHRLGEVFRICDSVTVLRNGALVATRPVGELGRDGLIELMLGRALGHMYPPPAVAEAAARPALAIEGLRVPGAVERLDLTVPAGTIVCLAGQIGSGAAEAVAALAGLVPEAEGKVAVFGRPLPLGAPAAALGAGLMFVSGDRAAEGVFRSLSVRDNLVATRLGRLARLGLVSRRALGAAARRLATAVGVDVRRLGARADMLSGGNQQKLAFGRCLDRGGRGVIVMNEPTRGIDIGARADIYRLMRRFCAEGFGLLVASSDLDEVVGMGDVVVTLYRGRVVGRHARGAATMARIVADITHPHDAADAA